MKSIKNSNISQLFFLTLLIISAVIFLLDTFFADRLVWEHLLFHGALEASGATVALIMSIILYMRRSPEHGGKYVLIGSAFFIMGSIDGIHSLLYPGHAFSLAIV